MNIAVLTDDFTIEKWQLEALKNIQDIAETVLLINCTNTKYKRYYLINFLYYLWNYFFVRNKFRKKTNIYKSKLFNKIQIVNFKSVIDGNWQSIPTDILQLLKDKKINIIVKFGLNLLKVNENYNQIKIISYHHGDPEFYRGKAPCFYEILQDFSHLGIIVQNITNEIDKGEILYEIKAKLYKSSYKKSLENCYKNSIPLLRKSILNLNANKKLKKNYNSKLNKLPSNFIFIKFMVKLFYNKLSRIIYLLFFYKKWKLAISNYKNINRLSFEYSELKFKSWKHLFFADPFFINKNEIIFEGFNFIRGVGEIIYYNMLNNNFKNISNSKTHLSYPSFFSVNKSKIILPEMAEDSQQHYYIYDEISNTIKNKKKIKGFENYKILDPTMLQYNDTFFIFCNLKNQPMENLYIFWSNDINNIFKPHKLNPVVTDIFSSRMAGNLIVENNILYRLGQNNSEGYGDGITINQIDVLSPTLYVESYFNKIKFEKTYGPHTFNIYQNLCISDSYEIKFNLLSFVFRFIQFSLKLIRKIIYNGH
jgi:hypothetical protein